MPNHYNHSIHDRQDQDDNMIDFFSMYTGIEDDDGEDEKGIVSGAEREDKAVGDVLDLTGSGFESEHDDEPEVQIMTATPESPPAVRPKRRGRPPGSKNKKTLAAEAAAARQAGPSKPKRTLADVLDEVVERATTSRRSSGVAPQSGSRPRKQARMSTEEEEDEDEEDDDVVAVADLPKLTAYIEISKSAGQASTKLKKGQTPERVVQRGPFIFNEKTPWGPKEAEGSFQRMLCKAIPCASEALHFTSATWHFESPKTASTTKKTIVDDVGYEAMIIALCKNAYKKTPGCTSVFINLQPPRVVEETWDKGNGDYVDDPYVHEDDSALPIDKTVKGQMHAMAAGSKNEMQLLRTRYPEDNEPRFPGKRVLKREIHGRTIYHILDNVALSVWANHLARGTPGVDIETPPNSAHFDPAKNVKPADEKENAPFPGHMGYAYPPMAMYSYSPQYPGPGPFYPPPYPGHHLQHRSHQDEYSGQHHPQGPHTNHPLHEHNHRYHEHHSASLLPQSPRSRPKLTLDEFCHKYDIDNDDMVCLVTLGYKPGLEVIERLDSDSVEKAGFAPMRWMAILDAHKKYVGKIPE